MFHQMSRRYTQDQLQQAFTLLEQQQERIIDREAAFHYEAQLLFVQTFRPTEAATFDARFAA